MNAAFVKAVPCLCLFGLVFGLVQNGDSTDTVDWLALAPFPTQTRRHAAGWEIVALTDEGAPYVLGQVSSSEESIQVSFDFGTTGLSTVNPVIILTVMKDTHGYAWSVPRIRSSWNTGFIAVLQSSTNNLHEGRKTVGYLAIDSGTGHIAGRPYQAIRTPAELKEQWMRYQYLMPVQQPAVFGTVSMAGPHPCNLVMQQPGTRAVNIRVQEPVECGADGVRRDNEKAYLLVLDHNGTTAQGDARVAMDLGQLTFPAAIPNGTTSRGRFSAAFQSAASSDSRPVVFFPGMIMFQEAFRAPSAEWNREHFSISIHQGQCPSGRMAPEQRPDYMPDPDNPWIPPVWLVAIGIVIICIVAVLGIVVACSHCRKRAPPAPQSQMRS